LKSMKRTGFLINASRGGLVCEKDLAEALNTGILAGAALDVVSAEPIDPDNPLLSAKNCLLTPHMAWSTLEARRRLMQGTAENIRSFIAGRPINVINRAFLV
ncbi:MAG TPA: D-2-hydroxyacid dehydrogenase, partial [Desulfobacteraceae bacterium]|nr:D-2-hydroxyacid dehydrogenase [Desulfobacteraceae bacterium]